MHTFCFVGIDPVVSVQLGDRGQIERHGRKLVDAIHNHLLKGTGNGVQITRYNMGLLEPT
jgi:hypothetical protein